MREWSRKFNVGNRISDVLAKKGMTQGDLARKIGVPKPQLSRIVNRKVIPSIRTALAIAWAMGVRVEDIFFLEEDTLQFLEDIQNKRIIVLG